MAQRNQQTMKLCKEVFSTAKGSTDRFRGIVERIIKDIAEEENLTLEDVRKMVKATFLFTEKLHKIGVKNAIEETDNIPVVRWKYFGKFVPSAFKIKKYIKRVKARTLEEEKHVNDRQ